MNSRGWYSYSAYGLGIRSALSLPELVCCEGAEDVVVRFGELGRAQKAGKALRFVGGTAQKVHLEWRGIGAFEVREGREIVVDPFPGVEERVLRLVILGPCLRVLLLQRGLSVFHASVVGLAARAVAFLAPKGQGKSTMAAVLHSLGHDLVDDDVMVLDDDGDRLVVRPGYPQIRLRPDAAQAIGQDPEQLSVLHPQLEKRAHRMAVGFSQHSMPLERVYVLGAGEQIEIVPLAPRDALLHVLPNGYAVMFGGGLAQMFGLDTHFSASMRLVGCVPIYLLKRPYSLDILPDVARAVEEHGLGASEPIGV
jgi:hypothetical protein